MTMVIVLVLTFRSSSNLAAAYGIAVTGAMLIDSVLISVVLRQMWNWNRYVVAGLLALFFTVDFSYLSANLLKIPAGGWFPLLVGAIVFTFLTTWAKGRQLMINRMNEASLPMEIFIKSAAPSAARVPGTAVFMTSSASGVPHALLHNLKHNKVLHERVILLTVRIEDVPYVSEEKRVDQHDYGSGFYRVVLRYGFMEEIDVPTALAQLKGCGPQCKMMDTSFFLARQTLLAVIEARHGHLARETVRLDAAQRGKRDGILQASYQSRGGAGQSGGDLNLRRGPRILAGMADTISWVATIGTIVAASMTAANLGSRVTGYGFVVFTAGALCWIAVGALTHQPALMWTNVVLAVLDLFGIWRWLGRQSRVEEGARSAAEFERSHCRRGSLPSVAALTKRSRKRRERDRPLRRRDGGLR